jgi:hypothetical protein
LLGECDAFALAFADQRAFELGERAQTESSRLAIGESSPVR